MAKHGNGARRARWFGPLAVVVIVAAVATWFFRAPIVGYAELSTAHAARNVCSCRHIAGLQQGVCEEQFTLGTPPVWLSEDAAGQSVTARVPLVAANTATYREGYGCVLEPWGG